MNPSRSITPHAPVEQLLCSEFREGRDYTNWRPRGSGDWLLIVTVAGEGQIRVGSRTRALLPGDAVLFAPGAHQDYSTAPRAKFWHLRWAHFQPRPHWKAWLPWPEVGRGVGVIESRGAAANSLAAAMERMLILERLGGAGSVDLAMNALEEALLWAHRLVMEDPFARGDPRVQKAARYLASRPSEPFRLSALAEHCGLSVSRLSHVFKTQMHMSPQQFSERLRLEYAQQLLRQTALPIARIAEEVGFSDPLYFSRRFRRAFGRAPRDGRL